MLPKTQETQKPPKGTIVPLEAKKTAFLVNLIHWNALPIEVYNYGTTMFNL
jgi:hypothetical protein